MGIKRVCGGFGVHRLFKFGLILPPEVRVWSGYNLAKKVSHAHVNGTHYFSAEGRGDHKPVLYTFILYLSSKASL